MKWYHIRFTQSELAHHIDQKFIKEFVNFIHLSKSPSGLVLYGLKFELDLGIAFFISTPIQFENELKKILSNYSAQISSRPNLNLLYPIAGESEETTD